MTTEQLSIGDLADAAGVSRRAIRFYVQRGLLPPPQGKGRGSVYLPHHLERLQQIQQLQAAGHALDAIARLLQEGAPSTETKAASPSSGEARTASSPSRVTARLWTHLQLGEGLELHVDTHRHALTAEQILAVRDAVRNIIKGG
ncbi:MAG: MerR family transcriptional regulator, partial [Planctomycetota bacterium]